MDILSKVKEFIFLSLIFSGYGWPIVLISTLLVSLFLVRNWNRWLNILPKAFSGAFWGGSISWGLLYLWGWLYYDIFDNRGFGDPTGLYTYLLKLGVIMLGISFGFIIGAAKGNNAAMQHSQD